MKYIAILCALFVSTGLTQVSIEPAGNVDVSVEKVTHVRLKWEPSDGIESYLLESRPADGQDSKWNIRSVKGPSVVIESPKTPHEYRVRSIHPNYPEVISLPSDVVIFPSDNLLPDIVRIIGISKDGAFWEQDPLTKQWKRLM